MASAQARPYLASADIKLEYGVPQKFALKFTQGKSVESRFPGGRVMFTSLDERKLFLDDEDASDLERAMYSLSIGVADFMRVTKIRHPKGGGHSIRVERVDEKEDPGTLPVPRLKADADPDTRRPSRIAAQPPARIEAQLERSVAMARESGPAAFITPQPTQQAISPMSVAMVQAMCAAVDAVHETQAYAQRRGLGVTFSEESVRAIGLTIFIQTAKGGAR